MDQNAPGLLVGACGSGLGFGGQSCELGWWGVCVLGFARFGISERERAALSYWSDGMGCVSPRSLWGGVGWGGAGVRGLWSGCWAGVVQGPSQPMQVFLFLFL